MKNCAHLLTLLFVLFLVVTPMIADDLTVVKEISIDFLSEAKIDVEEVAFDFTWDINIALIPHYIGPNNEISLYKTIGYNSYNINVNNNYMDHSSESSLYYYLSDEILSYINIKADLSYERENRESRLPYNISLAPTGYINVDESRGEHQYLIGIL